MHDIYWIRQNADSFVRGLQRRGASDSDTQPLLGSTRPRCSKKKYYC